MLTFTLTGTTEATGSTTTNLFSIDPGHRGLQPTSDAESSRTMVRLEDGAALLTWDNSPLRSP
jgi:hypothetical protein